MEQDSLAPFVREGGIEQMVADESMAEVAIVGAGMKSHPGVAAKVFKTLGEEGINIEMISTSPIKISCVIPGDRLKEAVQSLHSAFQLAGADTMGPENPFGEFAA